MLPADPVGRKSMKDKFLCLSHHPSARGHEAREMQVGIGHRGLRKEAIPFNTSTQLNFETYE